MAKRLHAGLAFPKPRPAALERADRRNRLKADDLLENAKVKARSGGRCEIVLVFTFKKWHGPAWPTPRCTRRAVHIHHMIGGWGKRARGNSQLAEHKQYACAGCHSDITGHVLKRIGGTVPLWTDCYERTK